MPDDTQQTTYERSHVLFVLNPFPGSWIPQAFSREGHRPRVLFVRSGFSPPPGVGPRRGGGFFCRKNTVFLKRRLKNTCVLALWPLKGVLSYGRFYAYVRYSRLLCPLRLPCWKVVFYAYLRYSSPVCLLRMTSRKAFFMHICGTPAQFAYLE